MILFYNIMNKITVITANIVNSDTFHPSMNITYYDNEIKKFIKVKKILNANLIQDLSNGRVTPDEIFDSIRDLSGQTILDEEQVDELYEITFNSKSNSTRYKISKDGVEGDRIKRILISIRRNKKLNNIGI